ncbi:MAG: cytochrome c oxidase subunit 3 [Gammaproteobacteria bacterium]|nr:cytochrome c oxidase subunit 3 [Gammaproteobacteria bacterium]
MTADAQTSYYLPHGTKWPILGSIGLTLMLGGFAAMLNGGGAGSTFLILGALVIIAMMFLWFGQVISESENKLYNHQVDRSFRWGMGWFIFSEVCFFAAFFGALFYARMYSIPWIGGEGTGGSTNEFLWPNFESHWPTNGPENVGGDYQVMGAWGVPAINTAILLTSGLTVTWAHWGILKNNRFQFNFALLLTVLLGFIFVGFQAYEYYEAYNHLNLTLNTGMYGSTFFMLTGFHGFHVTIGAIMLLVMLIRGLRGHFDEDNHFAFEAAAWYWHFVDVVWLGLFIFVYWL